MPNSQAVLPYLAPIFLIVGCLVLKGVGIDSTVDTVLLAAAAFVFGFTLSRAPQRRR